MNTRHVSLYHRSTRKPDIRVRVLGVLSYLCSVFTPTNTYLRKMLTRECRDNNKRAVTFLLAAGARGVKQAGKVTNNPEIIAALFAGDRKSRCKEDVRTQELHSYARAYMHKHTYETVTEAPLRNYLLKFHACEYLSYIIFPVLTFIIFFAIASFVPVAIITINVCENGLPIDHNTCAVCDGLIGSFYEYLCSRYRVSSV